MTKKLFFVMNKYEGETTDFETEVEAEKHAEELIQGYLDGNTWMEGVDQICIGRYTGFVKQTEFRERPEILDEDGCDEEGEHWYDDHQYKCEYKIESINIPEEI